MTNVAKQFRSGSLCAQDLCKLVVNCELLEKWTDEPAYHLISSSIPPTVSAKTRAGTKAKAGEIEANL